MRCPKCNAQIPSNSNHWYFYQDYDIFIGMFTYCHICNAIIEANFEQILKVV